MDDLLFRRKATIEPESNDKDFLLQTDKSAENRQYVKQQQAVSRRFEAALKITPPENIAERIILAQQLFKQKTNKRHQQRRYFLTGITALILGTMIFLFTRPEYTSPGELSHQVFTHLSEDTHALDVNMEIPKTQIDTMLASYGGKLSHPIGKVSFLGHCIIGQQTGIHIVLHNNDSAVTIMILPASVLRQEQNISKGIYSGIIYPSTKGTIAIIGNKKNQIRETKARLNHSLRWLI